MIADLAARALVPGIDVYSAKIHPVKKGFHIQIELDGLKDAHGAVSIGDCEEYSARISSMLDEMIAAEDASLPPGIAVDNYTLEVSSAGAERELRLPQEFERFKDLPIKIVYRQEGKTGTGVFLYKGKDAEGKFLFESFETRRRKTEKRRSEKMELDLSDIQRVNLFLDF
jgi:ribosome maturation factor RimP